MDPNVDMTGCSTNQHHAPSFPSLCAAGCGFFGSEKNGGLCSKCYDHRLKETTAKNEAAYELKIAAAAPQEKKIVVAATPLTTSETDAANKAQPAKSRCGLCRRKVGLLGFKCRCGGGFCSTHRLPEAHNCTFDFKGAGKVLIEKQNPLCKADKMARRI